MPDTYEVMMTSATCGPDKLIEVDYPNISLDAGDTIILYNDLTPKEDAKFYVFRAGDKGGPPLTDFCKDAGAYLEIEKATGSVPGEGVCEVNADDGGAFQYKITADDHYDYDPIIIVEPKVLTMTSLTDVVESPVGGVLTLALLGGVASYSYIHGRNVERGRHKT
jgi:hypothetical protein